MDFPSLFSPLMVGPYRLHHRVVMAPLTLRAKRSNPSSRKEVWIASSLSLLAMTEETEAQT